MYSCCVDNNLYCTGASVIQRTQTTETLLSLSLLCDRDEMNIMTCIVNKVSRFPSLGRDHATFFTPDMQVLWYNILIF